jgi:hypothetical protein
MSKNRRIAIAVVLLIGALAVVIGAVWRFGGPFGASRKVVGDWEIAGSELKDTIRAAVEKKDPEAAEVVEDKLRSTERVHFGRDGDFRHTQDIFGITVASEGTWQVSERGDGTVLLKIHKTKMSVRNPKGESKEEPRDDTIEWVITRVEGDTLSATMTDADGKTQRFVLRRVKD